MEFHQDNQLTNPHIRQKNTAMQQVSELFLDLIQVIVMSLAIFVVVYIFLFQPNQVRGSSMVPTFENGEYILTDKVTYRWMRKPEYGDIIVFKSPENSNYDFIKRVIAIPGDVVKISQGKVSVNDTVLPETYLPDTVQTRSGAFLQEGIEYSVPDGGYVVFGDNRNGSSDSREWGPVPEENVVGRAWFRYWPPQRIGLISTADGMVK